MTESVLVDFVYCHPVGHAIEALQYCLGYKRADPRRRVGVVLNADTPAELAHWCADVDEVYTVDIDVFEPPEADVLAHIPRDWDWVFDDARGHQEWQREFFPGLGRYYELAGEHFRARRRHGVVGDGSAEYRPGERLRIEPPAAVPESGGVPQIAVLPAGSAERSLYPTLDSWVRILRAVRARFGEVRLRVLGKLTADGRTSTGFAAEEFTALAERVDGVRLDLDLPLAEQLALLRGCSMLLSPHTGFGFTALAVGTPWLVLAGNHWPEYYFNPGVPFYSVLPDIRRFPCYRPILGDGSLENPEPVEDEGPRSPSMCADRIESDLEELLDAAGLLLAGELDFEAAMTGHFRRLSALYVGRHERMYSVDGIHLNYLPG
ncbi:glycosyltransferase family 9 protein [Sciscionella sediminilitoris]|uniref:glycosyltransferase family 9 protein n=1 Tax=Sciscionella sediminilitoris TaxID=1445613 RepID=UPI0004DF220E|nr:hypothetical protein [Sciscionella sp. SE31]